MRLAVLTIALTACEWGGGPDSHGVLGTDARIRLDTGGGGADSAGPRAHVELSEIVLNSVGGELIEIVNPTMQPVDLTHYYLADIGEYWQLPMAAPNVLNSDFIVQFPAGASLAPSAVATISISSAATFMGIYTVAPTYSITAGDMIATAVGTGPTLTDAGELVVLFSWDGTADLVQDVDIMIAGSPSAANGLMPSKSGVMQGASTYATDTNTIAAQASAPGSGLSTKRIMSESAHETQGSMGNGITGHDETSEASAMTWDTTYTAPTPGQVPAGL